MKTKTILSILCGVLVCFVGSSADGALVAATDSSSPGGVNNVTSDTATGLDWLDLTASSGISFDNILLQFGTGGTYEGWRHATQAEVNDLIVNSVGLPLANQPILDPIAVQFVTFFGITQTSSVTSSVAARGRYNDDLTGSIANSAGSAFVAYRTGSSFLPDFTEASILDDQPVINSVVPISGTGHWLVRATSDTPAVPEPATFVQAALGLLGLGWFVKRRKHAAMSSKS